LSNSIPADDNRRGASPEAREGHASTSSTLRRPRIEQTRIRCRRLDIHGVLAESAIAVELRIRATIDGKKLENCLEGSVIAAAMP
jgi:hypothetical protein